MTELRVFTHLAVFFHTIYAGLILVRTYKVV
jgi:hypothetical protein